jgi:cytochrome bd ubiquinol oxidase subunit I
VLAGIFGSISVVSANAWMNAPAGFTLDSNGNVIEVDPVRVIFNDSMPWQAAHMLVAAYLVGGFLVASVYAVGMLRGRRDRYHYLGFVIAFTVGAVATPIQIGIGDGLARWVYSNQPVKFAAIELVPTTSSDVPETLLGHLNEDGTVTGGIPIPGLASWLSDPSTGRATVVQGLDTVPPDQRPTIRQTNIVHLCWDVMVGLGTLLFLLAVWYAVSWIFRRRMPASRWFLRAAAAAGVAAVITMEAGWIVTEVGRQRPASDEHRHPLGFRGGVCGRHLLPLHAPRCPPELPAPADACSTGVRSPCVAVPHPAAAVADLGAVCGVAHHRADHLLRLRTQALAAQP